MSSDEEMLDPSSHAGSLFSEPVDEDELGAQSGGEDREDQYAGDRLAGYDDEELSDGGVISLSLTEFVTRAKWLAEHQDAPDVFCKFVLNGVHEDQQYQVDPIKDAIGRNDAVYVYRDYDSVLGLGKHIYLNCDVTLHPVSKIEDTLQRNIHIKRSFTNLHVRI